MRTTRLIPTLLFCCLFLSPALAQDDDLFNDGNVVFVTMIRTGANMQDNYLKQLNSYYMPMMKKAKVQGLILDYSLLVGGKANEDDFDVMLMVEHKNMASLDKDPARKAKWDAIEKELDTALGGEEKTEEMVRNYENIRHMKGTKLMRRQLPK